MALVPVPCDLCGEVPSKLLYPGNLPVDVNEPQASFSSSRSRADHLPIVRCVRCGLIRSNPRDDDATLQRVYANLRDEIYETEEPNRRQVASDYLRLVTRYLATPSRLLDLGCATGTFACLAHHAGWTVTGQDASEWAVGQARLKCPGVSFHVGFLQGNEFRPASFDVATLWDVLEHLPSPTVSLRHVHDWLAEAGWLFLNVPNVSSGIARVLGRRWMLLLREHLWYFSPQTIEALLRKTGFALVHVRPNTVRFSASNILLRLSQYPAASASSMTKWFEGRSLFRRVSFRFPMGEMNVVARKVAR